jgi:hypothetical protein
MSRIYSLFSFVMFWILFYQWFFVYHMGYNVPIIQFFKLKDYKKRDYRLTILMISCLTSFYTTIHYLMPLSYQTRMFSIEGILRFTIMMLMIFYYITMATQPIFSKKEYSLLKYTLTGLYLFFMVFMIYSSIEVVNLLDHHKLLDTQLCISWNYMSVKWSQILCAFIFLIVAVYIQSRVEEEFKKKLLKINYD